LERKGVYYKKPSNVPLIGKVTGVEQVVLKNGTKKGEWVTYEFTVELHKKIM
jgi:hypothetical protein